MPDQQQYSEDEFANQIKTKYPDYKDWDNKYLVNEITTKHPEYKSWIKTTSEAKGTWEHRGIAGDVWHTPDESKLKSIIGGEAGRQDERIFSVNQEPMHQAIANRASKLPRSLQWPAAFAGSFYAGLPINILEAIFGSPEGPALLGAGAAKGALKSASAAETVGRLKSLVNKDAGTTGFMPIATESHLESHGLPPAPSDVLNPIVEPQVPKPSFIAGDAGVAENRPYNIDIAPTNPRLGQLDAGTIFPRETEQLSQIPPEMAASRGISPLEPIPTIDESDRLLRQIQTKSNQLKGNYPTKRLPNQLPSAIKPIEEPKPAMDVINSEPRLAAKSEDLVLPQPGQAKPIKDISAFTANFTSPDQTLGSHEVTKPIADVIVRANDEKMQWIASTERELSELSQGLNKNDRTILGRLIDGQIVPEALPELQTRAQQARTILDSVHGMFPEGATKAGENVGYLDNYFTHLQEQPDSIKSALGKILDHHLGIFKSGELLPEDISSGSTREAIAREPSSPYVEKRSGAMKEIDYDVNKVFPAYVESAARVIFDKPAIESATAHLAEVPDSNLKELATWYIRNYSNYDSLPGLHQAWQSWASSIARTTARSLLGFNTGLQTLHLARVSANLWPELGSKYTAYGLQEIASKPIQAWTEAAKLGLLQQEIRPFAFKTPMERFDSVSNFLSMADYIDKAAGYHGYKKMFLDRGMSEGEASLEALKQTKRVSQTSDAARQMKGFSPESNFIGGEVGAKLGGQFKQVPAKIVEQYIRIASDAKNNPQAAMRMVIGAGIAIGGMEAGLRTFHISPLHMIPMETMGAFGQIALGIIRKLAKGDWQGALTDTALWTIPGGKSIERQLEKGPSALQP